MAVKDVNLQPLRRSSRNAKRNLESGDALDSSGRKVEQLKKIKLESPAAKLQQRRKIIKSEPDQPSVAAHHTLTSPSPKPKRQNPSSPDKASLLQARKLKSFSTHASTTPFPAFAHPTPSECSLAHKILSSIHGARQRPDVSTPIVAPRDLAGCGTSPSVLDALVRTILSQNTSDKNSARAKRAMDAEYGGSDHWEEIARGGRERLQRTIQCGGLSVVKSKVIMTILQQVQERYGKYSLDHLFQASDDEAMREMLSFQGVGPKTASCVLLFCLQRDSFAVDTHVYRITGLLGWRPDGASREEAQAHLDARVPDGDKYGLHVLLVTHGRQCDECKAGGKNLGKCELRKAFRKGKLIGEAGEEVKQEEVKQIKKEEEMEA